MTRPFPDSLCHRCQHNRYVQTKRGATFLRCAALAQKYLPQPVVRCRAFQPATPGASSP